MKISSPDFKNSDLIPSRFSCDGENINPPLKFTDIPNEAKSLALIVDDPDAPGKTWVHWLVWNISPQTKQITAGRVPEEAIEGTTDFSQPGYGGPCPPSGTHRYFFRLYALDIQLNLDTTAQRQDLESAMSGHVLDQAELMGKYSR